jgi:hypothetical protein
MLGRWFVVVREVESGKGEELRAEACVVMLLWHLRA